MKRRAGTTVFSALIALLLSAGVFLLLQARGLPSPAASAALAGARIPALHLPQPDTSTLKALADRVEADMLPVAGGRFVSGEMAQDVTVGAFLLCSHEATFEEIDAFTADTGRPPVGDRGWGRGRRPALYMSWYDAVEYCNWLSALAGLRPCYTVLRDRTDPLNSAFHDGLKWTVRWDRSADGYRLPTEAEWEFAARGGALDRGLTYPGSNAAAEVAWYQDTSMGMTHEVGGMQPNEIGAHDMGGNVWEWTWDWFAEEHGPVSDPAGPDAGSARSIKGGSWFFDAKGVESRFRKTANPATRTSWVGFRVARGARGGETW